MSNSAPCMLLPRMRTHQARARHAPCTRPARARHARGTRQARARQRGVTTITRSTIVHRYLTGSIEFFQARQGARPENNVRGSKISSIRIGARRAYKHNKHLPELRTIVHLDEKLVPLVPQKIGFADACA